MFDESSLPPPQVSAAVAYERITGRRLPFDERTDFHFTYAMACPGFVKIGRCTHITRRLRQIRNACPLPVSMLGFVVGDVESDVFSRLRDAGIRPLRARGEWFKDTPNLRAALEVFGLMRGSNG